MENNNVTIMRELDKAREIAIKLGYKNIKSALNDNAQYFIDFQVNKVSTNSYISKNNQHYSIDFEDNKLPEKTVDFLFDSLIGYYNYQAIISNLNGYFSVYNKATQENTSFDITSFIDDDSIKGVDSQSTSKKLDLLFLKNKSTGELLKSTIDFENLMFNLFGGYQKTGDSEIENFKEALINRVDKNHSDTMEQNFISCLSRASDRKNSIININIGCKNLIDSFSGVNHENYHERILQLYNDKKEKYLSVDDRMTKNEELLKQLSDSESSVVEYKKYIEYANNRTIQSIQNDKSKKLDEIREKELILNKTLQEIKNLKDNEINYISNRETYLKKQAILEADKKSKKAQVDNLKHDLDQIISEESILFPKGVALDRPIEIEYNGKKIKVMNAVKAQEVIDTKFNVEISKTKNAITTNDAYLLSAYSSILYAMDFDHIGGEIVSAIKKLEDIGYNKSDLEFNSEQIKQALSISNNIHGLISEDSLNLDVLNPETDKAQTLNRINNEIKQNIYDIYSKYVDSTNAETKENMPAKFDSKLLMKQISVLCSDEDVSDNPFLAREKEIVEQITIALNDTKELMSIENFNNFMYSMKNFNPKLKNVQYRSKMQSYYEKNKLIPVLYIELDKVQYNLEKEYTPSNTFQPKTNTSSKETINFCGQMGKAIQREIEILDVSMMKGKSYIGKDGKRTEFENHYLDNLIKVKDIFSKFENNPKGFEEYQNKLSSKISSLKDGESLTEEEFLMFRFCPTFNSMLNDYQNKIKNTKNPTHLEIGKTNTNSILPESLNEGIKFALLTINNSAFDEKTKTFKFNIPNATKAIEVFKAFTENAKQTLNAYTQTEEYKKFKDFLTFDIVDGKFTITNDTYVQDGKVYKTSMYDKENITDKENTKITPNNFSNLPQTSTIYVIENGDLKELKYTDFVSSSKNNENVVQIASGKYAVESDVGKINSLVAQGLTKSAQANKSDLLSFVKANYNSGKEIEEDKENEEPDKGGKE